MAEPSLSCRIVIPRAQDSWIVTLEKGSERQVGLMINIDRGQIISDPPRRNFLLVYPDVPSLSTTLQGIVVAPTLKMDFINQGTR